MPGHLILTVRFYEGRYHGNGDWPPAPGRLFQALLAGAAIGPLTESARESLAWLERLPAPIVACPHSWPGQLVRVFVPDNDWDTVSGDHARIEEIRSEKSIRPRLFDPLIPVHYIWSLAAEERSRASDVCALALGLYQLGRGVDMAWACGQIIDEAELEKKLAVHGGQVHRPSLRGNGTALRCPQVGTLASLEARHAAGARRFRLNPVGKTSHTLFSQPPKARFSQVAYSGPLSRRLYELRGDSQSDVLASWPLKAASRLVLLVRDVAADRLRQALPAQVEWVERFLVGRRSSGEYEAPAGARIRIVPLPSIGHRFADHRIRRVLVDVPACCPLRPDDVHWAFSGVELAEPQDSSETTTLVPTDDETQLTHYGSVGYGFRVWRTVTAAALPYVRGRLRSRGDHTRPFHMTGQDRSVAEASAAWSVIQALRHAGLSDSVERIRVQREPFESRGECAAAFGGHGRFDSRLLRHVEVSFAGPVSGPLALGNGRFLGLGVMAPVDIVQEIQAFSIESGLRPAPAPILTKALRRAVIARVQMTLGDRQTLSPFFTGHHDDGSPARTEQNPHLAFAFDAPRHRLFIVAPHLLERRPPSRQEVMDLRLLDSAMERFCELLAGGAGKLILRPAVVDFDRDRLLASANAWESVTPYQVTRHAKREDAAAALAADVLSECHRRGLPTPRIAVLRVEVMPGLGICGWLRLDFQTALQGPVLLGRTRHLGGGLFQAVSSESRRAATP